MDRLCSADSARNIAISASGSLIDWGKSETSAVF
jgi:hypothetical protein